MDAIKILGSLLSSGALAKGGSGGNILGSLIGAALGGSRNQPTQSGGSLGDLLGSVLGSGAGQGSSAGGLGDLLGGLLGGGKTASSSGGLGDLLGSALGGGGESRSAPSDAGGLEDLLGVGKSGGLGGLLGGALAKYGQVNNPRVPTPSPDDHGMLPQGLDPRAATVQAELMIRAMINAAKSDGSFDEEEQQKILSKLGDITQDEIDFIRREFAAPLDVEGFANSVPRGMEHQIYAISLSAINLDENSEAQYLGELAGALRIDASEANQIHSQLGAPKIFA